MDLQVPWVLGVRARFSRGPSGRPETSPTREAVVIEIPPQDAAAGTVGGPGSLQSEGSQASVVFRRLLGHPIQDVWDAITDPAQIEAWFMAKVTREDRAGGRLEMEHPNHVRASGQVLEWRPPRIYEYRVEPSRRRRASRGGVLGRPVGTDFRGRRHAPRADPPEAHPPDRGRVLPRPPVVSRPPGGPFGRGPVAGPPLARAVAPSGECASAVVTSERFRTVRAARVSPRGVSSSGVPWLRSWPHAGAGAPESVDAGAVAPSQGRSRAGPTGAAHEVGGWGPPGGDPRRDGSASRRRQSLRDPNPVDSVIIFGTRLGWPVGDSRSRGSGF